jgi:competence protein ComEC
MTLVYLAIAWIGGIWLAHQLWSLGVIGCGTPGWVFWAGAAVAVAAGVLLRRRPQARLAAAMAALCILGAARYQAQPLAPCLTPADLAFYNGTAEHPARAAIEGVIVGYPDTKEALVSYRLRAERLTIGTETRPMQGDVLVQAARFPEYVYGDRIRAAGQLETPPTYDDFNYAAYLSVRGVDSLLRRGRIELIARDQGSPFWAALYNLRSRCSVLLDRILPEPAASLANGMLLGIEGGIPPDISEAFKATGTTHVIVISGSNIALLTGVLMGLLGLLIGKRRAAWPTAVAVVLYVLLVGADPSALRAGVMGVLFVLASVLGRASTAYVSLCFAALIMTLNNPLALWDVGFLLSFLATLGLILFTPSIQARFERFFSSRLPQEHAHWILSFLSTGLIVTLAVQILTLPLIVFYFGRLSVVGLLANLLILPAQPPIMVGGMVTLIVGLIWGLLGQIAAVVPWFFLTYTTVVVETLAAAPFASVETGTLGRAAVVLYFVVLLIALIGRGRPQLHPLLRLLPAPRRTAAWLAVAVVPALLMLTAVNLRPDGQLHVTFIPGADGEASLITTPGGRQAWVWDGQGDGEAVVAATRSSLRGWRPGVDVAIGPDAGKLWPGARSLDPARTPAGTVVRLGDGVDLVRLPVGDGWLLRYGEFTALLPSTLRPEAQTALLQSTLESLPVTLLKTPGAGAASWPTAAFLDAIRPQIILWPLDTTYPPDGTEWLTAHNASRVVEDALVDVTVADGKVWVQQRSLGGRR